MASSLVPCWLGTPRGIQASNSSFQRRSRLTQAIEDGCSTSYTKLSSFSSSRILRTPCQCPRRLGGRNSNTVARAAQEDLPSPSESESAATDWVSVSLNDESKVLFVVAMLEVNQPPDIMWQKWFNLSCSKIASVRIF